MAILLDEVRAESRCEIRPSVRGGLPGRGLSPEFEFELGERGPGDVRRAGLPG